MYPWKTYYCSGPEANQWARIIQDMVMNEYYEDYTAGDDACSYARSGWYVAVTDEYGFRYLYRYKNNADAESAYNRMVKEALHDVA